MTNVIPFPKRPVRERLNKEVGPGLRESIEWRIGERLALKAAAGNPVILSLIARYPKMKELVDAYMRGHMDGDGDNVA